MKKVIESSRPVVRWLESVKADLDFHNVTHITLDLLDQAIAELKSPRWYTPKQWEQCTGKAWPDSGAVYWRYKRDMEREDKKWYINIYILALRSAKYVGMANDAKQIICATEAGPPPEDWEPGENNVT
jgi:hypothetical protein